VFEVKADTMDRENTDLTIEAIKLVELLSSLNIEDFQMNQWIFLIDGYGMKMETGGQGASSKDGGSSQAQSERTDHTRQKGKGSTAASSTPSNDNQEVFKTFIVRFIGNQQYSFYNVEKPQDGASLAADFDFSDEEAEARSYGGASYNAADLVPASPHSKGGVAGEQPQSSIMGQATGMGGPVVRHPGNSAPLRPGEFDPRLQEHACSLQQSLNAQNVVGNEFNRHEAESKIEIDFLKNDEMINN